MDCLAAESNEVAKAPVPSVVGRFYGDGEKSATLYEIYFETRQRKPVITLGLMGKLRKERGHLIAEEIEFGIGTYDRIQKLTGVMAERQAVVIPARYVVPGKAMCDAP